MLQRLHQRARLASGSQCWSLGKGSSALPSRQHQPLGRCQCLTLERTPLRSSTGLQCDVVLSSGFLAFAYHSGFLQAVEEAGVEVTGVMGTSAGAFAGALYCAGYSPRQVAAELSRDTPIDLLRCSLEPWKGGFFCMDPVIDRLRDLLPPRFEDLDREFAVGVVTAGGEHLVIDSGPLPEAVVASAAIPFVFESVHIPGHPEDCNPFKDGGVVDRVGLRAWRNRRRAQARHQGTEAAHVPPALVHVIARSSPFSGFDDVEAQQEPDVTIFHSPRSGVNFFSLGEFEDQLHASLHRAKPRLLQAVQARSSTALASAAAAAAAAAGVGANGTGAGGALSNGVLQPIPVMAEQQLGAEASSRLARTGL